MASKCRKFVPNIFNKTKCQTCFGSKEQHSAEALENNKASRKVSKCGYLFVAPGYDFSNPLDKTRRWQRRFFVLYDDGELAYSVDENPDTVPQGVVDMNKCTDVKDATGSTSHSNSLAITTPEKTTYIKGNSKEEIQWWHDVLIVYPRSMIKPKQRRFTVPSYSFLNKENLQTLAAKASENKENASRFEVEKVKQKDQPLTYRGVRSMKHKGDKHYQEGLRKSSSLHDLSTEEKEMGSLENSRFLSRSGDRLDSTDGGSTLSDSARLLAGYTNPYATLPRNITWQSPSPAKPLQSSNKQDSSSASSISSVTSQSGASASDTAPRRGSLDDKAVPSKSRNASERARMHRERSASMKTFPTGFTLPKIPSSVGSSGVERIGVNRPESTSSVQHGSGGTASENETDEFKMAKSSEMQAVTRATPPPPSPTRPSGVSGPTKFEETSVKQPKHVSVSPDPPEPQQDLMYMKKGWLIKMGSSEKDWKKHWFVLTGNSLRYYKDAKAEETNSLDGRIDLSSCYEITEVQIQRNYGFKIKTRNGEYILSAMTSGIRSNWMKAIRLCMDLQNSNKNKSPAQSSDSSTVVSPTASDDIEVNTAAAARLTQAPENTKQPEKKDFTRNIRRHYSDVNPGNIGKMFSIKGLTLDSKSLSHSLASGSPSSSTVSSASSSKEPSVERESRSEQKTSPPQPEVSVIPKQGKYQAPQHTWLGDGIPFRRFVEGSDSHVIPPPTTEVTTKSSSEKREEEERKRRNKSPSVRIKEKTRAKSPKLHSPPPGHEPEEKFTFRPTVSSDHTEDDNISVSSGDMDIVDGDHIDSIHLDADDNLTSTMSSQGEGMLVDILENEVESLKERLEHTEKELAKSHDSNRDLKTKLQTVVREKDSSSQLQASIDSAFTNTAALAQQSQGDSHQMNNLKRQLKDAKDTIQRQKTDIDGLKSKLDMSVSKLTGTEKALSEALKDVKVEKDKFLKVTNDYNRKVRSLEGQLREVTQKMEKYHENSLIKDKENRKLDNDLKSHQQLLREHEREILKLKAVEYEYRQMKEKFDDTSNTLSRMRIELSEKDAHIKKMEADYEQQFENLMQEFTKERDATEQHIEDIKTQLLEAQRKTNVSDSLSSNMADILQEKDEIIAQLEEKVIESESKMEEMNEELKNFDEDNTSLQQEIETVQEERENALIKIKEVEKSLSHFQNQVTRFEKENASIRKHMDDLRKENTDLCERLDSEKLDSSGLIHVNDELKMQIKDLENEVHILHKKLTDVCSSHDRLSVSSDGHSTQELLHSFILATSEVNDISDYVLKMRKQFEDVLSKYKGEQKTQLIAIAEMLEDLGRKCENVSEVLKEGSEIPNEKEAMQKESAAVLDASASSMELEAMKASNLESEKEVQKLQKEIKETQSKFSELKAEDNELREKVKLLEENYQRKIQSLGDRVEDLASKNKIELNTEPGEKLKKGRKSKGSAKSKRLSEEIVSQLSELEDQVGIIEKVMYVQDLSVSSVDTHTETEGEETESESEESDDFTDSDDEDDEVTDDETQEDSTVTDTSENLLGKLKEMKHQLELTNSKVKHLTADFSDVSVSGMESDICIEGELRQTLIKCGEKIDSLTSRLSDGLKCARAEIPRFSDNTWAFQKCVSKLKDKVTEVSVMVNEHDEINAKDLKGLQDKMRYLLEFVGQIDKLGENDWDVAGKIAKQEMKFQHLLANRESATRKSNLKYEDKLQLYADKLAFEAMILGQMGILIQRQQIGNMYKDSLLKEIHEANLQTLELERQVDSTTRDMTKVDQDKDLVSSYASILAEKIVLEGQLASSAMVQDMEASQNMEVLSSLQVDESPSVLAMEIFLRSQVDSAVNEQLQKLAENMNNVSNHIVTKALLQGEITHALQVVKQKFKSKEPCDDLSSLIKTERKFAYDQLSARHKMILDIVSETEPVIMTTLIQLIEYTQGPTAPTLDSVCEIISERINKEIKQYQESLQTADAHTKVKIEHIISHLQTELEDVISMFREEYQCYVQTASPDIDPNVLKFSADTLSSELAGIFVQKAKIEGMFAFVSEVYMSTPDVPVSQMMEPLEQENEGLSGLARSLGQILLTEAANKQALAAEVRNLPSDKESDDATMNSISNLVGVIPDLEAYPHSFDAYAATLVREAMFQSHLTYTTYKLKLQYHRQLRDIKLRMEAGEKVVLSSEISREAESDIQASLAIFEEILDTKSQDESAVLSLLESEIEKLKAVPSDKSCSKCKTFDTNLKQLENSFQHEISVVQDRQNVHIDVLRQEVNNVILRVEKFLEDHEREKDKLIADYEDRILTLQDEFDIMKIDHEEELEQVKQDIMTAVSAIKASEEEEESMTSVDQLRNHNKQLMKMSTLCKELLTEIKANLNTADRGEHLSEKIETQLTQLQEIETDPNFMLDVSLPLSTHIDVIPGSPPTVTEPPPLDRSLTAERSDENVDKLLEKSQHEHEMELLKREKEEALAEEMKITKAALDAMRKAYEEEVEQEKEKYRDALKTMFTDNYVEDIRRRHDLEMEKIREELRQISMHYDSKCEDYKLLEDRLQRTKGEYQTHITQLQKSNEHLTETVSSEIEQLKEFIQNNTKGRLTGSASLEEELYDAQIMVRVKDAELQKLRGQVKNTENSLERITEEQRYTMTNYLKAMKKNQELQAKLKEEVTAPKTQKDSAAHDEQLLKNARALRRNPSFHQRARSPSPERTSPRKDSEHHSRESNRRSSRHLSAKDLKRSKSSPVLPYVFEARAGASSSASGSRTSAPTTGVSRRESGKYKSQKKQ